MKKITLSLVLCFFFVGNALAVAPLVIPMVVSASLHVAGAAAGLYYWMKSGASSSVSSAGDVSRPSKVAWVDLTLPVPTVVDKNVTAKVPFSRVKSLASSKPSQYPTVYTAVQNSTAFPANTALVNGILYNTSNTASTFTNKYRDSNTTWWQLGPPPSYTCNGPNNLISSTGKDSGVTQAYCDAAVPKDGGYPECGTALYTRTCTTYTLANQTAPAPDPSVFKSIVAPSGTVSSNYQAELDKMMQEPDYVPTFTDDTTGLPFSPPPSSSVATPAQIATINSKESATQAVASATTAATNAGNAYTASGGNLSTGVGGDPSLYQKYLDTKAQADSVQAYLDQKTENDTEEESVIAPDIGSAYGDGTSHDFSARLSSFFADLKTSSIFGLPSQVLGNIPGGGQSSFNISMGRYGQTTFDLADYGNSINIIRILVLVTFSIAGLRIITLKGGSG